MVVRLLFVMEPQFRAFPLVLCFDDVDGSVISLPKPGALGDEVAFFNFYGGCLKRHHLTIFELPIDVIERRGKPYELSACEGNMGQAPSKAKPIAAPSEGSRWRLTRRDWFAMLRSCWV